MKPQVWPTERPFVVFLIPSERMTEYAVAMARLTAQVVDDLNWTTDDVNTLGFIAATPRQGTEGIFFLEEMGVDTRSITLLMLWGDTAKAVNFEEVIPEECGIGAVILAATGVVVPAVRMPSLENGWWDDPLHHEYAATVLTNLFKNGRSELDGSEPHIFMASPHTWN